jgi:hypothetical protein
MAISFCAQSVVAMLVGVALAFRKKHRTAWKHFFFNRKRGKSTKVTHENAPRLAFPKIPSASSSDAIQADSYKMAGSNPLQLVPGSSANFNTNNSTDNGIRGSSESDDNFNEMILCESNEGPY